MIDKFKWMAARLSLMTPGEILHRANREWVVRFARPKSDETPSGTLSSREVRWYVDLSQKEDIRSLLRGTYHWTDEAASHLLEHKFSVFSLKDFDFGSKIRWNFDPKNGIEAPLEYGLTLDYRDSKKFGEIKYIWEPSRFLHLSELAKAFYLSGERKYGLEVLSQVESWIEQCPHLLGVHWSSSLESGIRVINWCFAYQWLVSADAAFVSENSAFFAQWRKSIYQHLSFINRNISANSSANNHRIGEVAGLFIGSLCFSFKESDAWAKKGREILETEALKQNFADGVNKEQALSYQAFVFDFLLLSGLLGGKNGHVFGPAFWQRLEKMAGYTSAVVDEEGAAPQIGDEDDGRVVRLAPEEGSGPFRSLLATSAALFGRADFKDKAGAFDEKSFWILGFKGCEDFSKASKRVTETGSFPEGGYFFLRDRGMRLMFDCGPLGYLSIAAHGHADALSFLLDYQNKPFFVDRGTYAYHADKVWRNYFRGTSAHNTVKIDRQDQSVIGGNFMWLQKAQSKLLGRGPDFVHGRHDGYRRLKDPVIHEREIRYDRAARRLTVTDRILAKGKHTVELFFQLDPRCVCEEGGNGFVTILHGGAKMALEWDRRIRPGNIFIGSLSPLAGWHSPGYDRKVPAPTLWARTETEGNTELVTTIELL